MTLKYISGHLKSSFLFPLKVYNEMNTLWWMKFHGTVQHHRITQANFVDINIKTFNWHLKAYSKETFQGLYMNELRELHP